MEHLKKNSIKYAHYKNRFFVVENIIENENNL